LLYPPQCDIFRVSPTRSGHFQEASHALSAFVEHPEIRDRFKDLHPPLSAQAAAVESNRCLNCFDAPCMAACPTHIDVPGFIKRIATGNLRGSARKILEANILAGSCSRVCPVEVLCEGACVMHRYDRPPIQIAQLQRHAIDAFHHSGEPLIPNPPPESNLRVACIGSGPASLACAAELRRQGAKVAIFERRALPGGLNTYGVAEYKLSTADSLREVDLIRQSGVEFRLNTSIETASQLTDLQSEFDFIFLGLGLGAMQRLNIPGEEAHAIQRAHQTSGVLNALELIAAYKTGHLTALPGTVIVIGAGNTAIDAAVAARRLGAESVTMLYRREEVHVSAFDFELSHARHEGIHFLWRRVPVAIRTSEDDRLLLDTLSVRQSGDQKDQLEVIPGSQLTLPCDTVIPAIGQSPLVELLKEFSHIAIENGRVVIDRPTGQTTNPRFFAGGDCTNGGREVVDAVADGKRAALGILAAFEAQTEAAHA
jgi:dihydropyrimidine dehydrogenase (NAD+) subunit PreT